MNDEVLSSDNPLFVVNGRSNVGGMAATQVKMCMCAATYARVHAVVCVYMYKCCVH